MKKAITYICLLALMMGLILLFLKAFTLSSSSEIFKTHKNQQSEQEQQVENNATKSGESDVVDSDYENIPEYEGSIQGRLDNNDTVTEYVNVPGVQKLGNVEIYNMKIGKIDSGKCTFIADVTNTSEEYSKAESLSIKVLDENGEVKDSFGGILTDLAGLETSKFKTYVLEDITYASDVKIEIANNNN